MQSEQGATNITSSLRQLNRSMQIKGIHPRNKEEFESSNQNWLTVWPSLNELNEGQFSLVGHPVLQDYKIS